MWHIESNTPQQPQDKVIPRVCHVCPSQTCHRRWLHNRVCYFMVVPCIWKYQKIHIVSYNSIRNVARKGQLDHWVNVTNSKSLTGKGGHFSVCDGPRNQCSFDMFWTNSAQWVITEIQFSQRLSCKWEAANSAIPTAMAKQCEKACALKPAIIRVNTLESSVASRHLTVLH